MILTVCLNPCTDVTIEVDSLNVGKINHVKNKTLSFTGAALNVAIGVARLHGQSYATGFMYNENGSQFEQALDREGVPSVFVWNKGRVRENYKFIDNKSMLTEVNDVGECISEHKQDELVDIVGNLSKTCSVMIVSGSLPQGVESGYYSRLFSVAAPNTLKIADTEGAKLLAALSTGLDLVKPNKDELQSTLQQEFKSREDMLKGCYALLDKGAKRVLLSLGKRGAIITDGSKNYYCKSINVAINSTVGAGDGMVAAAAMMPRTGRPPQRDLAGGRRRGHRDGDDLRADLLYEGKIRRNFRKHQSGGILSVAHGRGCQKRCRSEGDHAHRREPDRGPRLYPSIRCAIRASSAAGRARSCKKSAATRGAWSSRGSRDTCTTSATASTARATPSRARCSRTRS